VLALVVRQQAAKSMQLAQYFSTGDEGGMTTWHHYALAMSHYTHFTSPIRRYPDIIVHRLLQAAIWNVSAHHSTVTGGGLHNSPLWGTEELSHHASHCNEMKWASKAAQEASTNLFLKVYLDKHPLEHQPAIVTSIGTFSFSVYVPALATDFKIDDRLLTVKPTWTSPNRPKDGQVSQLGSISFEWDPAKMPGGRQHAGKGNRDGQKVVLEVKLLSRVAVRIFVDKSAHPWAIVVNLEAPAAAHALL